MPYVRKGRCVFKKNGGKVGCSKTTEQAKQYLKKLQSVAHKEKSSGEK